VLPLLAHLARDEKAAEGPAQPAGGQEGLQQAIEQQVSCRK